MYFTSIASFIVDRKRKRDSAETPYSLPHYYILVFDLLESSMIIEKSSSSLGLAMIDCILTKTASMNTYSISKDCLVVYNLFYIEE